MKCVQFNIRPQIEKTLSGDIYFLPGIIILITSKLSIIAGSTIATSAPRSALSAARPEPEWPQEGKS